MKRQNGNMTLLHEYVDASFKRWKIQIISLLLIVLFAVPHPVRGEVAESLQQKKVTGVVKDEDGQPIAFAYVLVKGKNTGTTTLEDGTYEINLQEDVTLIFNYVGYTSIEIPTKGRTVINVVMRQDNVLDEVVVTGFNTVDRKHLASSIEAVDMSKTQTRPIGKLEEAFGGTVSGVVLNKSSSIPGGGSSLHIRGQSTLQNASPLVIVDGMEQEMSDIDPTQVQSMTVLKDAAAASMYGSRGANGVIIIETKRGETGNFKVDVNMWGAIRSSIEKPDFVNAYDYAVLMNEAYAVQGLGNGGVYKTPQELEDIKSGKNHSVNWLDEISSKRAHTLNGTANISGGGGVGRFNLMVGYNKEKGETGLEGATKFSTRFNTNINLADQFSIMADFAASKLEVDRNFEGNGNTIYNQAWQMNPLQQIMYDSEVTGLDIPNHYELHNDLNPVAYSRFGGFRKNMYDRIAINLRPRYYVLPSFHLAGDVSYYIKTSSHKKERQTFKFFDEIGRPAKSWAHEVGGEQGASESQLTARITGNYEGNVRGGKDKIYAVGGAEMMSNVFTNYNEYSKASFFGKATYVFDNRYIAEVTLRGDGSSKFAPGNQWGFFPSTSLGWNVHNESFLKSLVSDNGLNLLKFRFSYGEIGNENVDPYLWQEIVNTWGWTMRVPNPDFTWEKQKQYNAAVDFSFLNSRLSGTFEVYNKDSYDLIYGDFPVPPLTGSYYLVTAMNIGEVKNKGWELSLNWGDNINGFSYSIGARLFDNKNSVEKAGHTKDARLVFKDNADKIWYRGVPIDNFYGYTTNGYFQSQEEIDNTKAKFTGTQVGDIKYVDLNGDGILNDEDKVILGDPNPRYNYSVDLSLAYKNWDFFFLGQGVGKRDGAILGLEGQPVINGGTVDYQGTPRQQFMDGRWTLDNPNSRFPRMWVGTSPNGYLSDVWISDASYFRFKSLQLGYTFRKVTRGISNLRIYANLEDFVTITNWEGLNPERIRGGNGAYPMMATYSFGVQVKFF